MRILHVNKFGAPKGGAEIYMRRTALRQSEAGHDVGIHSAPYNEGDSLPGIKKFDYDIIEFHDVQGSAKLRAAASVVWSPGAASALERTLAAFRPDIVHIHNYAHQLSSSIIKSLNRSGTPCVYTAHDYKLICPAYIAKRQGHDCLDCSFNTRERVLRHRCLHDSATWSAVALAEAKVTRSQQLIPDAVIAPSEYMFKALSDSWIGSSTSVALIRNPVAPADWMWCGPGEYLLYVGRLSREKGVHDLVEAAEYADVPLVLAGDGPIRADLEKRHSKHAGLRLVGHVDQTALEELRKSCIAQVIPSTWPENAPLSGLEAAAAGVPLIVAHRGGLPEFIELGARGVTYQGNSISGSELQRCLAEVRGMSGNHDQFMAELDWDLHLKNLEMQYERAHAR